MWLIVEYSSHCEVLDDSYKQIAMFFHDDPEVRMDDARAFLGAIHKEYQVSKVTTESSGNLQGWGK